MSIPKPEEIEHFVRQYITALESLLKGLYSDVKKLNYKRNFPIVFPVSVKIYQASSGIWIYFIKSDFFSYQITHNHLDGIKCSQFIPYNLFSHYKDKGARKAKMDIETYISLPDMIKQHEEIMQNQNEYDCYQNMSYELEYYLSYMKKSQEIIDETKQNNFSELYNMFEIVIHYFSRYDRLIEEDCDTMCILLPMLNTDIETVLFLALHGKYYSSLSISRKILEVTIRAIYLDFFLQFDDYLIEIKNEWLQGERFKYIFSKVMDKLLPNDDNNYITNILYDLNIMKDNNLKDKIKELYSVLSKYVHLRPRKDLFDTTILFSEYDEKKFDHVYRYIIEIMRFTDIILFMKYPKILINSSFNEFPEFSYEEYNNLKVKLCTNRV